MRNARMTIWVVVVCVMAVVNVAMAIEINTFENSKCLIELGWPGGSELIWMTGDSTMQVFFEGPELGSAYDDDGDGLDDVNSQLTVFDFAGFSPTLGPVYLHLSAVPQSQGIMEEVANTQPGRLDVPPFSPAGAVYSFFDVFLEVTFAGQTLHNGSVECLSSVITHEPPGPGDFYENPEVTTLLDANGNPTGFTLGTPRYIPNPPIEVDVFDYSECQLQLTTPEQGVQTVQMTGNSTMRVFFEGLVLGSAQDDNGNGLDDVQTELTQWTFSGLNPELGLVQMHLSSNGPALGGMEEQANTTSGTLDVPPFGKTGTCDSFFDIFLEVQLPGQVLHSQTPIHLTETINHKPPVAGNIWNNQNSVQLYDESNNPTRYSATAMAYEPNALEPVCGDAEHPYPTGDLNFDCKVNFEDFAIVANQWLVCTAPECD